MARFLKTLRRLPVKEELKDIATFINRELLPFIGELVTSTDTVEENTSDSSDALAEPEYIVKSANATLTNEKVADDSDEIDLDYTVPSTLSWFLKTASVAFSKLSNLSGLSVLGRNTNSSGVMAAITSTGGYQKLASNNAGTSIGWESDLSAMHGASVTGALNPFLLPATIRNGDTLFWTLTGNTTLTEMLMSDSSTPPSGFGINLAVVDQSGGAAPGFTLTIPDDSASVTPSGKFITPGQVQGTSPGPSYVMQSEEEAISLLYIVDRWRIIGGTAAQAISGDVVVSSGNGSTRVAAIGTGVIVNADVNAAAGIALSKLASQSANTIVANGNAGAGAPSAIVVGVNTVVGRVGGNINTAPLVNAQVDTNAAIALSKLATQAADSFVGNFTNAVAVPTARAGTSIAGTGLTYTTGGTLSVTIPLTDADKGDITVSSSGTVFTLDNAVVNPARLAVIGSNIATSFTIFINATSGGTVGTADDVTIYSSNTPFAFRIVDVRPIISTAVALSTVELRDTSGGGGSLLSSSFTSATAGEAAIAASWTATSTVAANGSVFLRRSDRSVVLQLVVTCIRI